MFFIDLTQKEFYERWVHIMDAENGLMLFEISSDTILKIYKLSENRPEINEFQNPLKSPSGEPKVGSGNFAVKK